MINSLAKLLKILNSEARPAQVSLGFAFAMIVGFTPLFSLHNLLVILLLLIIRTNLSAFILGFALFSAIGYLLDPLFHSVGEALLSSDGLRGVWTGMYNTTFWRLAHFNNTIVMGSIVVSLVLFIPLVLLLNVLIDKYRESLLQWVQKSRVMQILKGSKLFNAYRSLSGLGDA